jgi:YrbI family 3-deoxy-D-manno-octulosonate 8-phosphate phosphatase
MTTYALIPLRGGSRGIPGKNIKLIAGRPLCHWVIEAASRCPLIDRVFVSTDSREIAEVVQSTGFPVHVVDRSAEAASDTASTESVMKEFLIAWPCDDLVTIQATSPLTEASDLEAAIRQYREQKLDSLLTGVRVKRFFWDFSGRPLNYDPASRPRRQEFAGSLMENGSFYITNTTLFAKTSCRLGGKIGCFVMPDAHAAELDEPRDWIELERVLRQRKASGQIRMMVFDVDGTLTDGTAFYTADGEMGKSFSLRDGKGFELLRKAGVTVAICTQETTPIITARAKKLGVTEVVLGAIDKEQALRDLATRTGIPLAEIGFMGDDVNDLGAMRIAGWSACPRDAHPDVIRQALFCCQSAGGSGAAREACDFVVARGAPTA